MAVTFRAASGGQSSVAALTASVTQPTGATTGDLVLVAINIKNSTSDTFQALAGWTLSSQNANAFSPPFKTAVYWKVLTSGDTWPKTFTWASTTAKFAWNALAFTPGAGNTMAIDGQAAVKVDTTGASTHTANAQTAVAASVCSVIINCGRTSAGAITAITVTPATNWTEPTNAEQSTASGTTTALAQLGVESCYRTGQSGTITPGASTWSQSTIAANVYHFLLKDVAAATTANAVLATGAGEAWNSAEVSPPLELSQFGTFTGVTASTPILGVTLVVNQFVTSASMGAPTYELWDYSGTPALIGTTQTGTVSLTTSNTDTFFFTGVTNAQLSTLRVRVYGRQGSAAPGAQLAVGWASLTVTYSADTGTGLAPQQQIRRVRKVVPQPPTRAIYR